MQKHKDTLSWAVGIFEGEGNIYRNDKRRHFIMQMKMKDEDIIRRFRDVVDCGRVKQRKPFQNYAPMWEWSLTTTNDILKLAKRFLPYLGIRRSEQIQKAIKGKRKVKARKTLIDTSVINCGYMSANEISSRGARKHVRLGEKPCSTCAEKQRLYLKQWREANQ